MTANKSNWTKSSWKNFPALQQPSWPDQEGVENVLANLSLLPPLVFAGEIRNLKKKLAMAVTGDAFLLQGGDVRREFLLEFEHLGAVELREKALEFPGQAVLRRCRHVPPRGMWCRPKRYGSSRLYKRSRVQ